MKYKFSKIDIGSIRRRAKPKKVRHKVKREALSPEFVFFWHQAMERKVLERPKKLDVISIQRPILQIASLAIIGLLLIGVLQSLTFLSSAKTASGQILGEATSVYSDLHSAGLNLSNQNFASASQLFDAAETNVQAAQDKLNNFQILKWLAPQANSAGHVLTGAGLLAQAGKKLSAALSLFDEVKLSSKGLENQNINEKIISNRQLLANSRDLVVKASAEFNAANSLPLDYTGTLDAAKQQTSELNDILNQLVGLEDLYLGLSQSQKTYLLIFQNYDEQRATGGFIGTYGILKVNQGAIIDLKIDSIYDLDGQIYEQIAAPGPMQPEIKQWGIRDANWFADFPTSAQKLLYFFEKGAETADGVISMTPALFENILKLTGPISMDQYGVTLTSDNFQQLVQFKTSVDYDKTLNQPKKFLADFAPVLLNRLSNFNKDQLLALFQIFEDSLVQRQILIFSQDQQTQNQIIDLGFAGQILASDNDYLSIVNTNLGGTKTDLSMDQNAKLDVKVLSDGSVLNTLSIARKSSAEANNNDYLRVLVPLGSELVSASGFDDHPYFESKADGLRTDPDLAAWDIGTLHSSVFVRIESGKTEFAGWLNTNPAAERTVTVTYILPFKINQSYSLLLQKQSGSKPYQFNGSLNPGPYTAKWLGSGFNSSGNNLNFTSDTNVDDFWPVVLSK